jgi:hypothetical protein
MKSLLFKEGASPFTQPADCGPCRLERTVTVRKNGRLYRVVVRDKVVVEDPMLVMVKVEAFAIAQGEPFVGRPPPRSIRDFLIKSNVTI